MQALLAICFIVGLPVVLYYYRRKNRLKKLAAIQAELQRLTAENTQLKVLLDNSIPFLARERAERDSRFYQKAQAGMNLENPFGSYIFNLLKVSALFHLKERTLAEYSEGSISEIVFKIRVNWIEGEIARKLNDPDWDDTEISGR